MTAPDSPIAAPGTLDTSTGEPTPNHVRILPPPGRQQEFARLLLAAAGEDPQLVDYQPPHFVTTREVAEDAGLLDAENPSPSVQLHDRTVPFPPLYPAQEAHKMTPLAPPGERALSVAPNAAYKGPGAEPAEAPGGYLPEATDAVRSWDSTGEGEGDPQGQLGAERRDVVQDQDLMGAYPNEFAIPGVERERGVVPAEPHTGLAEAEVVDRQAVDDTHADVPDTTPGDAAPPELDEPHAGAQATDTQSGVVATSAASSEGWDDGVEDMTIDEIRDKLASGQLDPARVRASEQAGRKRKGVLELVEE